MLRPEQKVAMEHVLSLRTQMRRGMLARDPKEMDAPRAGPLEPDELLEPFADSHTIPEDKPAEEL